MTSTQTLPRVTVAPPTGNSSDWRVVEQDGTVVDVRPTRGEARVLAREINGERANYSPTQEAPEPNVVEQAGQEWEYPEPEIPSPAAAVPEEPEQAPQPAEAENPKPARTPNTPEVPMKKTRIGALVPGDRLVRRDIGTVTVTGISKDGQRREVAYEKDDGTAHVYDSWAATHAKRLYRPGEAQPESAA